MKKDDLKKQKLTLTEWLTLYLVMTYAPTTRLITQFTIMKAHEMAWLTPFVSCLLYVPLLAVMVKFMKKFEGQSYYDIICSVFGTVAGKIICSILVIYLTLLLSLYIRYSTNKLVSTIYVGVDFRIFLFLGLLFVLVILRSGISTLGRMNKIIFMLLVIQVILTVLFLIKDIRIDNVVPFCSSDIPNLFKSTFYVTTITGYISFVFIFNDKITMDKNVTREFLKAGSFLIVTIAAIIFITLGVFGWRLTNKLNYVFFQAVKGITLFNNMTGLEALFLSFWFLTEFINSCVFSYCIIRLLRDIFNLKRELPLFNVFVIFIFFFAQYFSSNVFELTTFSKHIGVITNNILAVGLPFLVFLTAKIRKII